MFSSIASTLVIACSLVSVHAADDGSVCSSGTSASGECIGADSMVQVQHRPDKAEAAAKDGDQADCPSQTRSGVWCADHYDAVDICSKTDSTEDCLSKGMQECSKKSDCFGVGVHPGWWTGKNHGVKICNSAKLVTKGDWCTTICPSQTQNGVWCPEHYDKEDICGESDSTKTCLGKGIELCGQTEKCVGVVVHPRWWTKKKKGVKFCTSETLVSKPDWCTAITTTLDCDDKVWCRDHYDAKDLCEDGDSLSDCFAKGKKKCEDNASCFGVGIHPGWWTKKKKGVKICTSSTLESKKDWCTKITKSGT